MMKEDVCNMIQEIMGEMQCPKDFKCAKYGFALLCKVKNHWQRDLLDCLEPNPSDCTFVLSLNDSYVCECPLRVYIKKKLNK